MPYRCRTRDLDPTCWTSDRVSPPTTTMCGRCSPTHGGRPSWPCTGWPWTPLRFPASSLCSTAFPPGWLPTARRWTPGNSTPPFQGVEWELHCSARWPTPRAPPVSAGCGSSQPTTTRPPLRFYQHRGFDLSAVHRGAVTRARAELKPGIPLEVDGIPIRPEIDLTAHRDSIICRDTNRNEPSTRAGGSSPLKPPDPQADGPEVVTGLLLELHVHVVIEHRALDGLHTATALDLWVERDALPSDTVDRQPRLAA
jgi:hypothetical protein